MSKFPDFITKLEKFKDDNKITLNYADSRCYGWRLGSEAKKDLEKHLEESWPDAEQLQKDNFKRMFEVGRDLMGIQILSIIPGDTIYLLKVSEKTHNTSCEISQYFEDKIYTQKILKCPVTKSNFYWPEAIKIGSVDIQDSTKQYFDINESALSGVFTYDSDKYEAKDVYINGKINYKSAEMILTRYSKVNDETYDILLEEQKKWASGSGSSDSGDAGSNDSGSSDSTSEEEQELYEKEFDNLRISFIAYEGTVKNVFEFNITKD